ncbi:MAG: hypothetical protein RML95_13945 [Anaerolineae bacterium]|nr:hypothetical protein [Anaerolineae bacterium]
MELKGVVRNIRYTACVRTGELERLPAAAFDVNEARPFGVIIYDERGDEIVGHSKWVSPKRTRTYPFARIYNTYHLPRKVTIIPVIKDEGIGGDLDRINFITFSWMNLMNVYIVLAWYDEAKASSRGARKITSQRFNAQYVRERLFELRDYHQTALHWNTMHFQRDFVQVYRRAVERYQLLSERLGIPMHSPEMHFQLLDSLLVKGAFSIERFKAITLQGSRSAAIRETVTRHTSERTPVGDKVTIQVENQLGGEYFLTADGFYTETGRVVFREAKNVSTRKLPSLNDIQDGLFKLILFANMDRLTVDGVDTPFRVELYLSGNFKGSIALPSSSEDVAEFMSANGFSAREAHLIRLLSEEAATNARLSIVLEGHA